jgi:hypothetical protein
MAALYNRTGPAAFAYDGAMGSKRGVYRRIAVTLLVPIAALLLARISLPGVNTVVFERLFEAGSKSYDPAEHGIFCLGVRPFIWAAILVELLAVFIRRWRAWRLGGYEERGRLWTRVVIIALVAVLLQSFIFVRWLRGLSMSFYMFGDVVMGERNDPFWIAAQTLSLVAGTFLLFWLARVIDKFGAGNGLAVMIVAFMVPSVVQELYRFVNWSRYPILMPLGFAAVAVAGLTRLAGGRPMKPGVPTGEERLPTPASGLSPVVDGASAMMIPMQVAAFASFEMPEALTRGTTVNRALEIAVVGALCVLMTWLFNRPRLLAQTWKRGGAPNPDGAGIDDRVRAAFARSLAMALAICLLMTGIEWTCADAGLKITVVGLTMIACVTMDVVGEIQFRLRHGPLVPAWPVHRLFVLPVMLKALEAAGIPAFARGRRFRTLWNFFAPYVPVDILVPADQLAPAETILRARSGAV